MKNKFLISCFITIFYLLLLRWIMPELNPLRGAGLISYLPLLALFYVMHQKESKRHNHSAANNQYKPDTLKEDVKEEIIKSKRFFDFISLTNELILHGKTAEEIYSGICEIGVNTGGFVFSWIGIPDKESSHIKCIKWAGREEGYLNKIKSISTLDIPEGKGPSGRAIREGKYYYSNDIENDPAMTPWKDEALKRGYRSSIALPIFIDGKVEALYTIYASKKNFFTEEEIQLLERITKNISYALNVLENDKKRAAAEDKLQKVMMAVEQSSASIVITDITGCIEFANPAFFELTGYQPEEAIGANPRILKTGITQDIEYKKLWEVITSGKTWHGEFCNKKKNGEIYWEYAVISPIQNKKGEITNFVAVKENITERKKLEEKQKQMLEILENSEAYIGTTDLNANFIYGNIAMRRALEIEYEDIQTYNISQFRTAESHKILNEISSALNDNGKWTGENFYRSKNGNVIPVWQVVILHKSENGEPAYISTTAIDLSKNKEAEKEMVRLNKELRELSRHLHEISEIEKKQIGREIHDELGQALTAMKFDVFWLKKNIETAHEKIHQRLDELLDNIKNTIGSFRRIYSTLHPAMLEELGLGGAIEWQINNFVKSTGVHTSYNHSIKQSDIANNVSLVIYRVLQESLTNIMRYANANSVNIKLIEDDNNIKLFIQDDGLGFDPSKVDTKLHHGLIGMRERLYAVNGTLKIESGSNIGTSIIATISKK